MESVILELRAAEGGADSKLIVNELCSVYVRVANAHRL